MSPKSAWLMPFLLSFFPLFTHAEVGFSQHIFVDETRRRSLPTFVWFPTDVQKTETFAENIAFEGFQASQDAPIQKGRHPLFVLIHGTSGNWKNLSWLAWKLAQNGAIVISANHPGYTTGDATPLSVIRAWEQPRDISFLLDALSESAFRNHFDPKQIYVIGYSLGGYSALALAGAKLDMNQYPVFCTQNRDKSCQYFQKTFSAFDESFYQGFELEQTDPRITASIAIAPGFVESMTDESLKNIKITTLIIGAQKDENVPPNTHFLPKMKMFSQAITYQVISDASHFSFVQICKPAAMEILAEEGAEFVCQDGGNKTRQTIHEELYEMISHFLSQP